MTMTTTQVEQFRNDYRKKNISSRYSGWGHFSLTVSTTLLVIIGSLMALDKVQTVEWLTVPITFLYANFTEYFGHKGPMHHKKRFFELLFQRHAKEHHAFFTETITTFDNSKDFKAVLFPPIMLLFFFGGFALPMGILFYFLLSPNVAYLFVFTSAAYFLNYELLHFCYHIDGSSWGSKLPFMRALRRHHTIHHNRKFMSHYNFNITYPICDHLFGTYYREGTEK